MPGKRASGYREGVKRAFLAVPLAVALAAPATAQTPGLVPTVSKVTLTGIGEVKFGMTKEQAKEAAGVYLRDETVGECNILDAGPPGTPQGPFLYFVDDKFVKVVVGRKGFRTPANVGYRSPASTVRRKYKDTKRVANIGGGYNLVWTSKATPSAKYVFSIARSRVYQAASGVTPAIDQQECS